MEKTRNSAKITTPMNKVETKAVCLYAKSMTAWNAVWKKPVNLTFHNLAVFSGQVVILETLQQPHFGKILFFFGMKLSPLSYSVQGTRSCSHEAKLKKKKFWRGAGSSAIQSNQCSWTTLFSQSFLELFCTTVVPFEWILEKISKDYIFRKIAQVPRGKGWRG